MMKFIIKSLWINYIILGGKNMKWFFKFIIWFIVLTFISAISLWGCEDFIPLFGKFIEMIEITTNYDITFLDYLITVFGFELIAVISWGLKWFTHLMLND